MYNAKCRKNDGSEKKEGEPVAIYSIKYTETATAHFGVEANSEAEAIRRFKKWHAASDHICDVIYNSDLNECDASISNLPIKYLDKEDILTDNMYQQF